MYWRSAGQASDVEVGTDELRRDLGNDGIAVTAQSHHAGGNPMSQRGKAGFNPPRFPVCAGEEVECIPRVASQFNGSEFLRNCDGPALLAESCTVGVAHPTTFGP